MSDETVIVIALIGFPLTYLVIQAALLIYLFTHRD